MQTGHSQSLQRRLVTRSPIFYGWVVWVVATLAWAATSPGQSFSVSLFIDYFIADFNIDRTTVSTLYSLGTFVASLGLTFVGRQIDLHGNRRVSLTATVLFSLALVAWFWVAGPLALLIGFVAIRGLGQGALSLTSTTVIAQWFWRRRGLVLSLSTVIFSLFQAVYVPVLQRLLETYAWQQVWVMLGVGVFVAVFPLTWLLLQNRPEDYGLEPDGGRIRKSKSNASLPPPPVAADVEENWSLKEAMRSPLFWIFLSGRFLPPAWATGIVFHQVSIFEAVGHSARTAADTYALMSTLVAFFAIGTGILVDRIKPGLLLTSQLAALAFTSVMANVMTEPYQLVLYAIALALVMGSGGVFDNVVWVNLFGRQYQGAIRGFVVTLAVVGTSVGPVLFGLSYDVLGGYQPVLWFGAVLCIIPAILGLLVDKPIKRL